MYDKHPYAPTKVEEQQLCQQAQAEMKAFRALTGVEMQEIELKSAQELQAYVRSFLLFPTPENFGRIQECSARYTTAWMNGRKRVLSDL